jgi:hypothetical protein
VLSAHNHVPNILPNRPNNQRNRKPSLLFIFLRTDPLIPCPSVALNVKS